MRGNIELPNSEFILQLSLQATLNYFIVKSYHTLTIYNRPVSKSMFSLLKRGEISRIKLSSVD